MPSGIELGHPQCAWVLIREGDGGETRAVSGNYVSNILLYVVLQHVSVFRRVRKIAKSDY